MPETGGDDAAPPGTDADASPQLKLDIVDIGGTGTLNVLIQDTEPGIPNSRHTADIALPYRIAKYPVTVGDYQMCVDAGACQVPSERTDFCGTDVIDPPKDPATALSAYTYVPQSKPATEHLRLPVTCTTPAEAEAFCAWAGGRVARAGEWMHAARNNDSTPYPWGDAAATTAQAPAAATSPLPISQFEVGRHPSSASWSGAEDMALTRRELLGPEPKWDLSAPWSYVTLNDSLNLGWLGSGLDPIQNDGHMGVSGKFPTIGFRCVWSK